VTDLFRIDNVEAPKGKVDKHGFSIKPPIGDEECILRCLRNAPEGTEKQQVGRLINYYEKLKENSFKHNFW